MIDYILKRSKRKTAAIYIRDGGVEVRAPLRMPKRDIDKFVASKNKWITDKLAKSNEQTTRRESFALDYGSLVIYRGKQYPIQAKEINRAGFDGECFYMPLELTSAQIKDVCVQIYRKLAKQYLTERTLASAKQMSVTPAVIKINGACTRWGSCSAKKNINYSWRLVMAHDEIIDYVVVHEVAHLIEMNHSKRFWSVVENILPNYRERKAGLKKLQQRLGGEDWENK
jgi:predicted metal-dependent hydrolase